MKISRVVVAAALQYLMISGVHWNFRSISVVDESCLEEVKNDGFTHGHDATRETKDFLSIFICSWTI